MANQIIVQQNKHAHTHARARAVTRATVAKQTKQCVCAALDCDTSIASMILSLYRDSFHRVVHLLHVNAPEKHVASIVNVSHFDISPKCDRSQCTRQPTHRTVVANKRYSLFPVDLVMVTGRPPTCAVLPNAVRTLSCHSVNASIWHGSLNRVFWRGEDNSNNSFCEVAQCQSGTYQSQYQLAYDSESINIASTDGRLRNPARLWIIKQALVSNLFFFRSFFIGLFCRFTLLWHSHIILHLFAMNETLKHLDLWKQLYVALVLIIFGHRMKHRQHWFDLLWSLHMGIITVVIVFHWLSSCGSIFPPLAPHARRLFRHWSTGGYSQHRKMLCAGQCSSEFKPRSIILNADPFWWCLSVDAVLLGTLFHWVSKKT